MDIARQLLLICFLVFSGVLVLGLVVPWIAVWWEDTQNRRQVIRIYGTGGLLALLMYMALGIVEAIK
jgi:hypothetical protein